MMEIYKNNKKLHDNIKFKYILTYPEKLQVKLLYNSFIYNDNSDIFLSNYSRFVNNEDNKS